MAGRYGLQMSWNPYGHGVVNRMTFLPLLSTVEKAFLARLWESVHPADPRGENPSAYSGRERVERQLDVFRQLHLDKRIN